MKRPQTAILLIFAFLATFFAPIRAGWSCPDGTPCVADRGHGFVCAGDQCATQNSCCEAEQPLRCRHGVLPGEERPPGRGPEVEQPDHCRFSVSVEPQMVASAQPTAALWTPAIDALPAAPPMELTAPVTAPIWRSEHTLGYRPPPTLPAGPSRAPPLA